MAQVSDEEYDDIFSPSVRFLFQVRLAWGKLSGLCLELGLAVSCLALEFLLIAAVAHKDIVIPGARS